ncbi:MAG TPA: hypothetical protein ENJ01_02165 [Gammaproteobacteria bacterium]|nr:hypothetical protein [Gammaproteobacteria bacterium]
MKTKFLDKRNCHALLPPGHGLPMLQRLEECLYQINDRPGEFSDLFDKLIEHNKETLNKKHGSERLLNVPLDIAQGLFLVQKEINTQARDRPYAGPVQLHTVLEYGDGTVWKTVIPIQYLLKGWGDANAGHQCYVHAISKNVPRIGTVQQLISRQLSNSDSFYYVGITARNWLQRLDEHVAETRRGSRRLFYQTLRDSMGWQGVLYTSALKEVNLSYDEAMNWEESQVDGIASDQYGMNMIPGGFKGLKHLHKLGYTKNVRVSIEERDRAISEYVRENPRKGIPNQLIKAWWEDDEHYEQVNEAHPKRLSIDQRKEIRRLHAQGVSIPEITERVGALDDRQVNDFLSGKTYKRGTV